MKTLAELVTGTRDMLDEASARMWTDAQLRRWIMEGARDVARRAECLQDRDTIPAAAGVQEYDLPEGVVRVHRVEYQATGDNQRYTLEYRDWHTMDAVWWTSQTTTTSTPAMWTMWGFPPVLKLVVYPTPAVAGTFRVFYYRLPLELTDDGTSDDREVELPEGWHDLCVDYAMAMALRKDADPRWQEARGIYEQHLEDLLVTSIRWTDQAGMVTTETSMVPRWLWDEGY